MRRQLLALALLAIAAPASAATIYVRTDSTAGTQDGSTCTAGNSGTAAFATLKAAVDSLPATLTAPTIIEICNPAGAPEDTQQVASTPWDMTTSATNTLIVRTDANNRAKTPIDTTRYVLHCTDVATGCLYNNLPSHLTIDGLQIVLTENNGVGAVALKGSNANENAEDAIDVRLINNVVKCEIYGTVASTIGIESRYPKTAGVPSSTSAGVTYVVNNVVSGCRTGIDGDWDGMKIANNTSYANTYNFSTTNTGQYRNNLSAAPLSSNGIGFVGTFGADDTYNASDDGSQPTTNGTTCSPTFADDLRYDLHLESGDTCAKDAGTADPTGSGLFGTDFEGGTRSTWDRGADEYAVSIATAGTATASITEADVVAGGKTLTLTTTGATWEPATRRQIRYVGGQSGQFAGTVSTTTITFSLTNGLATTPAANDLVVVSFCVGATSDGTYDIETTAAVDYTLIGSELYANDTVDANLRVAYRFMPGTPETQFRFAGGTLNAADAGTWTVQVYRGVDSGTPMDVTATTATGIDTRLANPASITPSTTGAVIGIAGCGAGATGGNYDTSYLGERRTTTQADTNDALIASGYRLWTSGAYDGAAFTNGGTDTTSDSWAAVTYALRPTATTPFTDARATIASGCDSAQAEGTGWDARRSTILPTANVVRTSDTVATLTFAADATYNITAQETVTCTVPAAGLDTNAAIASAPTFTIDISGGAAAIQRLLLFGVGL